MSIVDPYKKVFSDVATFPKNVTIDLASRYAAAFGMKAIGNQIQKLFIEKTENNDYNFEYYPRLNKDPKISFEYSKLVVPDLDPLEFGAVLYGKQGAIFAPPLLMNFVQEKSLIETEVNDSDPVIIERWGTRPWDVTINGVLIDLENRRYPTHEIRRLNKNWQYNGVVKAIGTQFEERDIDTIYFRSISFTSVEGYQDTIQFTIEASSIRGVNFTLLKPRKTNYSVTASDAKITGIFQ
jgi:Domain of unknown function (DUF6046)